MFVNVPGSFRDPSGRVFDAGDTVLRTIQPCYREHWEQATESGLLSQLVEKGFLLEFKEVPPVEGAWKCVQAEKLPFISYPYEWSFPQLRDAALLTLEIQRCALNCGMTLKDASAYNVQFRGSRPVFIDLLSFEKRPDLAPWQAYRQFCMHFLAPLALQSFEPRLSRRWHGACYPPERNFQPDCKCMSTCTPRQKNALRMGAWPPSAPVKFASVPGSC